MLDQRLMLQCFHSRCRGSMTKYCRAVQGPEDRCHAFAQAFATVVWCLCTWHCTVRFCGGKTHPPYTGAMTQNTWQRRARVHRYHPSYSYYFLLLYLSSSIYRTCAKLVEQRRCETNSTNSDIYIYIHIIIT